jgi:hypothetical protein
MQEMRKTGAWGSNQLKGALAYEALTSHGLLASCKSLTPQRARAYLRIAIGQSGSFVAYRGIESGSAGTNEELRSFGASARFDHDVCSSPIMATSHATTTEKPGTWLRCSWPVLTTVEPRESGVFPRSPLLSSHNCPWSRGCHAPVRHRRKTLYPPPPNRPSRKPFTLDGKILAREARAE